MSRKRAEIATSKLKYGGEAGLTFMRRSCPCLASFDTSSDVFRNRRGQKLPLTSNCQRLFHTSLHIPVVLWRYSWRFQILQYPRRLKDPDSTTDRHSCSHEPGSWECGFVEPCGLGQSKGLATCWTMSKGEPRFAVTYAVRNQAAWGEGAYSPALGVQRKPFSS